MSPRKELRRLVTRLLGFAKISLLSVTKWLKNQNNGDENSSTILKVNSLITNSQIAIRQRFVYMTYVNYYKPPSPQETSRSSLCDFGILQKVLYLKIAIGRTTYYM